MRYDEALGEVQAQELYDTAANAKDPDKLAIYEQVGKEYGQTPTGKKAARQAKALAERLKRNEAAAAELLEKARKSKGPTQARLLQTIVSRYPEITIQITMHDYPTDATADLIDETIEGVEERVRQLVLEALQTNLALAGITSPIAVAVA